jgi:hypothetical protein
VSEKNFSPSANSTLQPMCLYIDVLQTVIQNIFCR